MIKRKKQSKKPNDNEFFIADKTASTEKEALGKECILFLAMNMSPNLHVKMLKYCEEWVKMCSATVQNVVEFFMCKKAAKAIGLLWLCWCYNEATFLG